MTSGERALPEIAAAILAGGRASRCRGLPKGLLELPGGVSIIERTIAVIRASRVAQVSIFANDPAPYRRLGLQILPDGRPGLGPLAGIETALRHYSGRCAGVLVLPCDLPGITSAVVCDLRRAFVKSCAPVVVAETRDGFWQPLCAVVRAEALGAVGSALDAGRLSVYRLWRDLGGTAVPFEDSRPFFNVNAPEDLARWLLRQGEREEAAACADT